MNSYGGLKTERTDDEIQTKNQLRNAKKKLKKKRKEIPKRTFGRTRVRDPQNPNCDQGIHQ